MAACASRTCFGGPDRCPSQNWDPRGVVGFEAFSLRRRDEFHRFLESALEEGPWRDRTTPNKTANPPTSRSRLACATFSGQCAW
jgi:hypothetical protein